MSGRKVQVPAGMPDAALDTVGVDGEMRGNAKIVLEAALDWLAKNPIVPMRDDINAIGCAWFKFFDPDMDDPQNKSFRDGMMAALDLWQRRMFLAPKPDVPEEIKDLLYVDDCGRMSLGGSILGHSDAVLEAYRRGQRSRERLA